MKKSRSVRLVLMGGASLALAACGDDGVPQDGRFFATAEECAVTRNDAECKSAKAESERIHAAEAPRFTRKQECEAEFGAGNCETREASGAGSYFMPIMAGYMLGNLLGGNRFNQPVYRGPGNSAVMPKGGKFFNVGSFASPTAGGRAGFQPAAQFAEVKRGGLGSTAMASRSAVGG